MDDAADTEKTIRDQVTEIIDAKIRPAIQADGGNIELVDVDDQGVVKVRLQGACAGCPSAQMTLKMGIERMLRENIPQVTEVVAVES